MLTDGDRVTNGCGDEKIRLVVNVVNGRFVVVENADAGTFIVVEMIGIDGDFVVNFGMYGEVVVVPFESPERKVQ